MELSGKTIVITGASSGLGKALALALARHRSNLALIARSKPRLEDLAVEVGTLGGTGRPFPIDVTSGPAVRAAVETIENEIGPIDALVCAAGLGRYQPLEEASDDEIHAMVDVNLKGTLFVSQAVYRRMIPRRHGTLIHVLSTAGREGKPRETIYCASKWGVMGFTKALNLEARKYGVRVTAFCPGAMETPFWDHELPDRRPSPDRMMDPAVAARAILHLLQMPDHIEIAEYAVRPCV